jgi:hypothetical protein
MSIALQADSSLPQGYLLVNGTAAATIKQDGSISAPSLSGTHYGPLAWLVKSSNYTASVGDRVAAVTTGGAWTLTLPSSPVIGNTIVVADGAYYWNTTNLTISASNTIEGLTQTLNCNVNGAMFTLLYNGSTWRVLV